MAVRYIGDAVIRITYRDRGDYAGSVCVGRGSSKRKCWHFEDLYAPAVGHGAGIAYDSPEAYDSMAESAVSFGSYYTTHNRGDDTPEWAPSEDVADAISEATMWAQNDDGTMLVRRSQEGQAFVPGSRRGGRLENPKKVTKTSTVSTTTTRVMNPGFFSNPWRG